MTDDLRDQLVDAVHQAAIEVLGPDADRAPAERAIDRLMPAIRAAITEARRESWDEGALWSATRSGYSRKTADRANPYAAGEHDNLRDQIKTALRKDGHSPWRSGSIAGRVTPLVQAAITEARRESWAHGYANGYMDSGCATVPPSAPMANPYAAGEHDTPADREPGCDCTFEPAGVSTYGCPVHDTPAGEPAVHEFVASPAPEITYCMGPGTRGFGVCGEQHDHPIHQPAQNPVTPMVVGADGREARHDYRPGNASWPAAYIGLCSHYIEGAGLCMRRESASIHTSPTQQPSDCQNQAIGECSPAEPCSPNCPPAQQSAGPDVRAQRSSVGQDSNVFESAVDTAAIRAEWLRQCGSCDADLPMACSCAKGDHRPVIDRLCDALDARDAEIRELRAARDHWRARWGEVVDEQNLVELTIERDDARARLAELRALCDEAEDPHVQVRVLPLGLVSIRHVRAILDRPEADRG